MNNTKKKYEVGFLIILILILAMSVGLKHIYKDKSEGKDQVNFTEGKAEDEMRLPLGIKDKKHLSYVALTDRILEGEIREENLSISEYVKLGSYFIRSSVGYENITELSLDVKEKKGLEDDFDSDYRLMYDRGFLNAFTEEEIINNDMVTVNHFTRTMSEILREYTPFQYIEDMEEEDIDEILGGVIPEDSPLCRKKKTLYLSDNKLLPTDIEGKVRYDDILTDLNFSIMIINLNDRIKYEKESEEYGGCAPCWEGDVIDGREATRPE